MAGMRIGMAFERTSTFPIDEAMNLTKAQMLLVDDSKMPDKYFTICLDDGKLYLYDKNATPSAETGRFTILQGGGSYDDAELRGKITANENAIAGMYTKTEVDNEIDTKLANFDHLDYKVADSAPTATEVVIEGVTVPVVEGTRYLVEVTGEDRFEEYVVLNGTVYDLGYATGTGSSALETALTVTNPIGKLTMNEILAANTSLAAIVRKMLSQTYYPTITAPSASLTYPNMPSLAKVGQTITSGAATASLNRGSIELQGNSTPRSGEATGYSITLKNASVTYDDANATGSFTVPAFTKDSPGMVELEATIAYDGGEQPKDSDGADYNSPLAAGSVKKALTTEFILPFYWGASSTATISDFTGLNEDLTKKVNTKEYRITTAIQHPVIAYNRTYGELTSILDQNGFETINGWTKSNVTVDGQNYAVYVHDNATTDTNARFTFKF